MADKPSALAGARVVGGRYLRSKRQENPDGRMPLMDHLRELRNRVVKVAIAIIAGAIVSWVFFDRIWAFMQRPYCQAVGYCKVNTLGHSLFISNVMDGFYLHIKVSIIAGAVITSPQAMVFNVFRAHGLKGSVPDVQRDVCDRHVMRAQGRQERLAEMKTRGGRSDRAGASREDGLIALPIRRAIVALDIGWKRNVADLLDRVLHGAPIVSP